MTSEGTTTQAREEAQRVAGTAGDEARHVAEDAKHEVRSLAEEAKSRTMDMAGDTGRRLKDEAEGQVSRAATAMRSMSRDLRSMSEAETDSGPDGMASQIARNVADWADQTAGTLEERGLDGLISDTERFARRNPGLFIAAAAGLGMLVGRVVRNAPKDDGNRQAGMGMRSEFGTARPTTGGVAGTEIGVPPPDPAPHVTPGTPPVAGTDPTRGVTDPRRLDP